MGGDGTWYRARPIAMKNHAFHPQRLSPSQVRGRSMCFQNLGMHESASRRNPGKSRKIPSKKTCKKRWKAWHFEYVCATLSTLVHRLFRKCTPSNAFSLFFAIPKNIGKALKGQHFHKNTVRKWWKGCTCIFGMSTLSLSLAWFFIEMLVLLK